MASCGARMGRSGCLLSGRLWPCRRSPIVDDMTTSKVRAVAVGAPPRDIRARCAGQWSCAPCGTPSGVRRQIAPRAVRRCSAGTVREGSRVLDRGFTLT